MNQKTKKSKLGKAGSALLWLLKVAMLVALATTVVRGKLPWEP